MRCINRYWYRFDICWNGEWWSFNWLYTSYYYRRTKLCNKRLNIQKNENFFDKNTNNCNEYSFIFNYQQCSMGKYWLQPVIQEYVAGFFFILRKVVRKWKQEYGDHICWWDSHGSGWNRENSATGYDHCIPASTFLLFFEGFTPETTTFERFPAGNPRNHCPGWISSYWNIPLEK